MWATCALSRFMRLTDSGRFGRLRLQTRLVPTPTNCLREKEGALERLVVCGDFNVAPTTRMCTIPRSGAARSCARRGARRFPRGLRVGLADTLRLHHPEPEFSAGGITGCSLSQKNRGLRIDAVLAGSELTAKCIDAGSRSRNCAKERPIRPRAGLGGVRSWLPAWNRRAGSCLRMMSRQAGGLSSGSTPRRAHPTLMWRPCLVPRTRSTSPPKPLLVNRWRLRFCKLWVARWREEN